MQPIEYTKPMVTMRAVEVGPRKKRQRQNLRNVAIVTIGLAGVIAVAAVAPNMFQLLGRSGALARLKYHSKTVLGRLKQKGDIEFEERDGKRYVWLTKRGEERFALEQQKMTLDEARPRKWDRRYRLVMFDVPEKRKKTRERLRYEMQDVGFLRIQDSAWVYPYDCEEFIAILKADLHIGKDVLYAVVEEIENDAVIRTHFRLPPK